MVKESRSFKQAVIIKTILLALLSTSQSLGLHHLNLTFMEKQKMTRDFSIWGVTQVLKKGRKMPQVTYASLDSNKGLCVVKNLNDYRPVHWDYLKKR